MRIMSRRVNDDLEAHKMATFMEQAGVTVFSVTFNGMRRDSRAMVDAATFIVWGKYPHKAQADEVDKAFGDWLNSLTPQKPYL